MPVSALMEHIVVQDFYPRLTQGLHARTHHTSFDRSKLRPALHQEILGEIIHGH